MPQRFSGWRERQAWQRRVLLLLSIGALLLVIGYYGFLMYSELQRDWQVQVETDTSTETLADLAQRGDLFQIAQRLESDPEISTTSLHTAREIALNRGHHLTAIVLATHENGSSLEDLKAQLAKGSRATEVIHQVREGRAIHAEDVFVVYSVLWYASQVDNEVATFTLGLLKKEGAAARPLVELVEEGGGSGVAIDRLTKYALEKVPGDETSYTIQRTRQVVTRYGNDF